MGVIFRNFNDFAEEVISRSTLRYIDGMQSSVEANTALCMEAEVKIIIFDADSMICKIRL